MRPADVFFDAITQIREELVEEAQQYVFRRRISWRQYAGAAAACLALALGLSLLIRSGGAGGMGGSSGGSDSGDGMADGMEDSCDIAPEPSEPLPSERSFTADVLEILDGGSLLVVPQPGSGVWSVADRVTVPVGDLTELPDVQPGDRILVVYSGEAGADFVEGVTEIRLLMG